MELSWRISHNNGIRQKCEGGWIPREAHDDLIVWIIWPNCILSINETRSQVLTLNKEVITSPRKFLCQLSVSLNVNNLKSLNSDDEHKRKPLWNKFYYFSSDSWILFNSPQSLSIELVSVRIIIIIQHLLFTVTHWFIRLGNFPELHYSHLSAA